MDIFGAEFSTTPCNPHQHSHVALSIKPHWSPVKAIEVHKLYMSPSGQNDFAALVSARYAHRSKDLCIGNFMKKSAIKTQRYNMMKLLLYHINKLITYFFFGYL